MGRGGGRGGSQTQYPSRRQAQVQDPVINGGPPTPLRGGHEVEEGLARRRQGGVEEEATGPSNRKEAACEPAPKEVNGTYHCEKFKSSKCDVCSHMTEGRTVLSSHFKVKHSIAGHNTHLPASQKVKTKWFVYLEECDHPEGTFQYVGSTDSMTHRWANTKSKCKSIANNENTKPGTGLEKHIKKGCSQYGPELKSVKISLLEQFNTTEDKLKEANHGGGAGCQCSQCISLKKIEDKWICRLGTYHGNFGLNERDEI